tara:strand:- start:302 stop:892 length:591 start_codon:yes stop_codon:yes gene_type:complete
MFGKWQTSPKEYVADVARFSEEVGELQWAAPQDWMCEPSVLAQTGLAVREHQGRTVQNYLTLRSLDPALPIIPVLQGWEYGDYLRHIDDYCDAGVDLCAEAVVGVGSVCRRQQTSEAAGIITTLRALGIRLHGFGVKQGGLAKYRLALDSADSLAWSYAARRGDPLEGCGHKNCANCLKYALRWRERIAGGGVSDV